MITLLEKNTYSSPVYTEIFGKFPRMASSSLSIIIVITTVCVCLSVRRRIPALLHGPGCKLGNGRGCPLVVRYRADLQSGHRYRCYDNIAPNAKCQRVLVLAVCRVSFY